MTQVRGPDGELLERVEFRLVYTTDSRPNRQNGQLVWRRRADGSYLLYTKSDDTRSILSGQSTGILYVQRTAFRAISPAKRCAMSNARQGG